MADLTIEQALDVGARLCHDGNHGSAIGLYRAVLIHEPKNVEAMVRLGASLFETMHWHEALFYFWRALKLDRKHPQAAMNYGLTLSQLGYPEEGLDEITRAVRLGDKLGLPPPVRAMQYNNLGNCLERLERHREALEALETGLRFDPTEGFAHFNRGVVLMKLNRPEDARDALLRSLELQDPREGTASRLNEADARYNLAIAQLLLGDLKEGFKNYEYRLIASSNDDRANFRLPQEKKWHGQTPLHSVRLLIHGEQGLGDAIMMLRYLSWVQSLGPAEIILVEHAAIRPLLQTEPGVTVLEPGESLVDRYDLWTAVMSLPYCYGVESTERIRQPYQFTISYDRLDHWAQFLPPRPRVAVNWAGNFRHKNDAHRSVPLAEFQKIFGAPVNFVSVQQLREEDRKTFELLLKYYPEKLVGCETNDLRDAAAILLQCDALVTCDTAIAHLGGSLLVPTWVLIPKHGTDWRWQLDRTDSPWYPSMKLYRQEEIGRWGPVLQRVKEDLRYIYGVYQCQ